MAEDDEFEMVPIAPVRRLERELKQMKEQIKGGDSQLAVQVIEILRMNQALVDQLSTRQAELMAKIGETNSNLQKLVASVDNLVGLLSAGAEEGAEEETRGEQTSRQRLDKIIEQNAVLINSLNVLAREMGKLGGQTVVGGSQK